VISPHYLWVVIVEGHGQQSKMSTDAMDLSYAKPSSVIASTQAHAKII